MKRYKFTHYYNPKFGKVFYKHKGSGVIVDSIFKPIKAISSAVFKKFAKPMAKKALEAGISHAGEKLSKKAAEKSGDLIMKKLAEKTVKKAAEKSGDLIMKKLAGKTAKMSIDDTIRNEDKLLRLTSGSSIKKNKYKR